MSAPDTTPAFTHINGDVFWSPGGSLVLTTDTMRADLIEMITEAGHDAAQAGSVDGVRQATRLLNELNTACRAARRVDRSWKDRSMTPAPWSISNGPLSVGDGFMVSHDDGHVGLVFTLEDARAVAALPEVVEAAVDLDKLTLVILSAVNYADRENLDKVSAGLKALRAALSKLEGKA